MERAVLPPSPQVSCPSVMIERNWFVYIIRASDDSLYTGITVDMPRRFQDHSEGRGARYFRGRRPVAIVYLESGFDRSGASRREAEIKRMSRDKKLALVSANPPLLPEVSGESSIPHT